MTLQLKTKARLFDLHCSVGLTDWDMDKELKLVMTTDQFDHDGKQHDRYVVQRPPTRAARRKDQFVWYDKTSDTFVRPSPWLFVNPNIACPIQYAEHTADLPTLCEPPLDPAENQHQLTTELQVFSSHDAPLQEELLCSVISSAEHMLKNEDLSCPPAKNRRKGKTRKARVRTPGLDLDRVPSGDSKTLKPGCWSRPPVSYCILIALALKSSHNGSLKVQEIYHFIRENFPYFQMAPASWKNNIRHNLCMNNRFSKNCDQLSRDGKRRPCFWHLTLAGRLWLKDQIRKLTGESFEELERSTSHPDIIRTLFAQ